MYVNPKLKLNKFRNVKCRTKKELFAQVGKVSQNITAFTGDELSEGAKLKTDELYEAAQRILQKEKETKNDASPDAK